MKRVGTGTVELQRPPAILGHAAVGGKKESEGPLARWFDQCYSDGHMGEKDWEAAEARLQAEAASLALQHAGLASHQVDLLFAGDLLNQCVASSFGLKDLHIPLLGQYGACSTMAQTLLMASCAVETGAAQRAMAVTSSHFCTAERQFRTPLEYGAQRPPTAQWTATAAGALVLGDEPPAGGPDLRITRCLAGRIVDPGVTDAANMGAAMAPAAADSILRFFEDVKADPGDYDGVYTGDLGMVGSRLLHEILGENGLDLVPRHEDCGLLLYDREAQDVHAGGSGCGCSASVLCGYLLGRMARGELRRILFCATGALLSSTTQQQGKSVPGICHIVEICNFAS